MRVAVVGGGITGLTTAFLLHERGAEVVVLEATERLGGKILTREVAGERLDVGADAFLARRPHTERLAARLGLGADLVAPAADRVWLWVGGRLCPLPEGTVLGVPGDLVALARSGVLSTAGLLRSAVEVLLPRTRLDGDVAVGRLVRARFGREVVDRLVEPLLGGVYAGRVDRLSLEAAATPVREAARHRSLLLGARAVRRGGGGEGPLFLTPREGMGALVDALASRLGTRVHRERPVVALEPGEATWRVVTDDGSLEVDAVVLAPPAPVTAKLLMPLVPGVAGLLSGIVHASVATVLLGYRRSRLPGTPRGSGMLVPRMEGRLVKAVTWTSAKWPQHAGGPHWWMRASVGRVGDTAWWTLDDAVLADRVQTELREAMGFGASADHRIVTRWPDALPQHDCGHRDRIGAVRQGLPRGLHLAGAAYDGIGVTSCVAQAKQVAGAIAERIAAR